MIHDGSQAWNNLFNQFLRDWPSVANEVGVLIGCSGGADSVALTRLADRVFRERNRNHETNCPPFIIAHFNHRLRGQASDGDEAFVASLSESLGRRFVVRRATTVLRPYSDEARLRIQRRQFFVETAKEIGCRHITVAHTADDQAETTLHHALRGTGAAGLSGMKPTTVIADDFVIRRPLLRIRREPIRIALEDLGQPWREDASNQDSSYTRNWLRNEVLPMVRTRLPKVDHALIRLASNQTQVNDFFSRLSQQWLGAFVADSKMPDGSVRIRIHRPNTTGLHRGWVHHHTLAQEPAIVAAACQRLYADYGLARGEMNQDHWSRLVEMILEPSEEGDAWRSRGHLPGHIEVQTNDTMVELICPP